MQQARDIYRQLYGMEAERKLFETHGDDMDKYIHLACSETDRGIRCTQCNEMTGIVELLQTRSADEGMTAYVVCTKCEYRRVFG